MRSFSLLALMVGVFASASTSLAADLKLIRVWHAYRDAEAFTRISEYFTGQEHNRRQTVLRTQPTDRAGYYFLARIDNPGLALPGAQIEITMITPTSAEPKTHLLITDLPAGVHVIQAGLTGADWATPETKPVAWRYRILDASGQEQAREQSFLWSAAPRPSTK